MRGGFAARGVALMVLVTGCNVPAPLKPGTSASGGQPERIATRLDLTDRCPITGESGRVEAAPVLLVALLPLVH